MRTLRGKTIILTRQNAHNAALAKILRAKGGRVIQAPLTATVPPRSWRSLDLMIQKFSEYEAVIFTSARAVESFFLRAARTTRPPRVVAAVGAATADAIKQRGWPVNFLARGETGAGLARGIKLSRGAKIALPRAEQGTNDLPKILKTRGFRVTRAAAYRTVADKRGQKILRTKLRAGHAVCFASESAVQSGCSAAGMRARLRDCALIAIGPTTARALKRRGLAAAAIASERNPKSFANAIIEALQK